MAGIDRLLQTLPKADQKVSMSAIKELRKRTGAPIAHVKRALQAEGGDIEAAIDYLRKMGATMAAKKAHREASQGLISLCISADKKMAAIVELNSETDFVARTPQFGQLARSFAQSAIARGISERGHIQPLDPPDLMECDGNKDLLSHAVSSLGENILLRRASVVQAGPGGSIFGYAHGGFEGSSGRIGVLVALSDSVQENLGTRVAMHVAAAAPLYTSVASIPEREAEEERLLLMEAAKSEHRPGSKLKPSHILDRIVDGRLKKWIAQVVLEKQEMLVEHPSFEEKPRSVSSALKCESADAKILHFTRFAVGDTV